MRPTGKDRAFAKLIQAYAASIGQGVRTAQRHAKKEHPDWVRFVQGQAVMVVKDSRPAAPEQVAALASMSPVRPPDEDPTSGKAEVELSEPEMVLRATFEMWQAHFDSWKKCLGGKERDDGMALSHAAACVKLRESYEKALQKFSQWEIEQRRVIPVNEFAAMRSEFVVPLGNLLAGLPAELAVMVNPKDPQFALAAMNGYLQSRLQPAIERLIGGMETYVAAA